MWVLYYFERDYDSSDCRLLASSSDKTKLETLKSKYVQERKDSLAEYNRIEAIKRKEWLSFYELSIEYWMKNESAIKNPYREDGLWVDEKIDNYKYYFRASGWSGNDTEQKPIKSLVVLNESEIDKRKQDLIKQLPHYIDTTKLPMGNLSKYADESKLEGSIPKFPGYSKEALTQVKIKGYAADNLIIEEVRNYKRGKWQL